MQFQEALDHFEQEIDGFIQGFTHHDEVELVIGVLGQGAEDALGEIQDSRAIFAAPPASVSQHGKGWAVKALLRLADYFHADLVLIEPDLLEAITYDGNPEALQTLIIPVIEAGYDLSLGCGSEPAPAGLGANLISPILAATYGWEVKNVLPSALALSRNLVERLAAKTTRWPEDAYSAGIYTFVLTTAIAQEAKVCEASLGAEMTKVRDQESAAHEIIRTLLRQVAEDYPKWSMSGQVLRFPGTIGLGVCPELADKEAFPSAAERFQRGYTSSLAGLLKRIVPTDTYSRLNFLAEASADHFNFQLDDWIQALFGILLAVKFRPDLSLDDLAESALMLALARRATVTQHGPDPNEIRRLHKRRQELLTEWERLKEEHSPVLPPVAFWEFIPGVAMTIPQEIVGYDGKIVSLIPVYETLLREYRQQFIDFVHQELSVPETATSAQVAQAVAGFIGKIEEGARRYLVTGDFRHEDGVRQNLDRLWGLLDPGETYALKDDVITKLLKENPPSRLLTKQGVGSVSLLLQQMGAREALALTAYTEGQSYDLRVFDWARKNLTSDDFSNRSLTYLVAGKGFSREPYEDRDVTRISRLAGVIVVLTLPEGAGGSYPTLRYLTTVGKNLVEAVTFGEIWRGFSRGRRKDFVHKVVSSLEGHWGNALFSAFNMFENGIQRRFVAALKDAVSELHASAGEDAAEQFYRELLLALDSYHLGLTLNDGQFIPLSIWSWASYSYKGGRGVPSPLSLHVERDWFSRELLVRCYEALEDPISIEEHIIELMAQGAESADLAEFLLPVQEDPKELLAEDQLQLEFPEAGQLRRFEGNPILRPIPEHDWESTYVLNNGAIRLAGRVYILYRAFGKDSVSRIGLAISDDGLQITERLPEPIFWPETPEESAGCEDPRIIQIGDRLYMTYTAYDWKVPQIAIASISVQDFLERRWERWQRHGMAFPGFPNKDAIIFPERFNGRYAMIHRVAPSMWLTYADELDCPWPRKGHKIIMGPRAGMLWDAIKIGAGAQPLKTRHGWLLIYHGVDYAITYSLGVMLIDLNDPGKLLYRSPNTILTPEEEYEKGERGKVWVPNVVFTCGAVPTRDTEILEDDDEVLAYYGAADTYIGVAKAKVRDLVPEEIRVGRQTPALV